MIGHEVISKGLIVFLSLPYEGLLILLWLQNKYNCDLCFPIYRTDFMCFQQEYDISDNHNSFRCCGVWRANVPSAMLPDLSVGPSRNERHSHRNANGSM